MLKTFFDYLLDMVISYGIKDIFAVTAVFNQRCLSEGSELVGNSGFCHIEEYSKVANAHFALVERPKYAGPCTVA